MFRVIKPEILLHVVTEKGLYPFLEATLRTLYLPSATRRVERPSIVKVVLKTFAGALKRQGAIELGMSQVETQTNIGRAKPSCPKPASFQSLTGASLAGALTIIPKQIPPAIAIGAAIHVAIPVMDIRVEIPTPTASVIPAA